MVVLVLLISVLYLILQYVDSSIRIKSWVSVSSDERIKDNIEDINDDTALQKILMIQPKTYNDINRVEKGNNKVYGFIAQQVKEMTSYAKDYAITIAVMGCRVNGPGETDDADLGLWCGPAKVNLKRRSEPLGAFGYDEILPKLRQELDALIAQQKPSAS